MSKRVNVGGSYMSVRERNTSLGKKGTFIGKWSPNKNSVSSTVASRSASRTIKNHSKALDWLGGGDR
jgi:hypothetical protein